MFLPGFVESGEHSLPREGVNLNYAEITFYSVIDPYFELFAVCHLSEEHFHLEEAYWLTKKLAAGFQLKAGKFLSSFGRINELHTHYWDFADRPLVHQAMFGDEGLNEIGARITWSHDGGVSRSRHGSILMGENEASFGRTGFLLPQENIHVSSVRGPGLFVGYLETSVDIGDASVLMRLSGAQGTTRSDEGGSSGAPNSRALSGSTTVLGGALTVKHTFDAIRYIFFQSEYLEAQRWDILRPRPGTASAPVGTGEASVRILRTGRGEIWPSRCAVGSDSTCFRATRLRKRAAKRSPRKSSTL